MAARSFTHLAYGLNIVSELECPELLPGHGAPDVRVRFGAVPDCLDSPKAQGVFYQVSPDQFLLNVEHIARESAPHARVHRKMLMAHWAD